MAFRLLAIGLFVLIGLCPGQEGGLGASAPLGGEAAAAAGTPVQQVLQVVDPESAGIQSERQAAEIERFLGRPRN